MWRIIELDFVTILIKGTAFIIMSAVVITAILFVVGETVEHFTP